MNVLSIGNSFSQDAHKYLHCIAEADHTELDCVNLMIGGCSLEQHAANIRDNCTSYDYEINGCEPKEKVSIAEALGRKKWDIITIQQVSQLAGQVDTFEPYMSEVINAIRAGVPDAEIFFHETWAYETTSAHSGFNNYDRNQLKMYESIHAAATKAADKIHAKLIPTGTVIQRIRREIPEFNYQAGGRSLNRDGFHLTLSYGRYAAAMVWYAAMTGRNVTDLNFVPECEKEPISPIIAEKIRFLIEKVISQ